MSPPASSADSTNEKTATTRFDREDEETNDKIRDSEAYILDVNGLGVEGRGLQTAHDGKLVLIPQPSSDPNDPLNWTPLRKHIILMVITVVAFLPDLGSSMGTVALISQAAYVASPCYCPPTSADCRFWFSSLLWRWALPLGVRLRQALIHTWQHES